MLRLNRLNFINKSIFSLKINVPSLCRRHESTESSPKDPIKYSTSKAATWKAAYSISGKEYFSSPKSESWVVMLSFAAFMIYFCILREENDIDEYLRGLETTMPRMIEEGSLRASIEVSKRNGTSYTHEQNRLNELVAKREKRL